MNGKAYVLDASALLALLHSENGAEVVESALSQSAISSVNFSEVLQKAIAAGVSVRGMRKDLEALGLLIVPFSAEQAQAAAALWPQTSKAGLSLGDRACLALAAEMGLPALTTDQSWAGLKLKIRVRVIR